MAPGLESVISQGGYAIVVIAVLLMNLGVPVPGHVTYLVAAVASGRGVLALPVLVPLACAAAIAGSYTGYALGRRGGRRLLETYGPKVGLTPPRVALMERFFLNHGLKSVFLMRFVVVVRTFGSVCAGVFRVPPARFTLVSALGAVAWAVFFGLAGYAFGDRWQQIEDVVGHVGLAVIGVLIVAAIVYALWRRFSARLRP